MYKISDLEKERFLNDHNLYANIKVYDSDSKAIVSYLEIHIESGEEYVPHMYIICKRREKDSILRVELLSNKYFGENDDKMNTLDSNERIALNRWMKQKVQYVDLTKWNFLLIMWNQYNPAHTKDSNAIHQPDYTIILEP